MAITQAQLDQYCENYTLCVQLSRNWLNASGCDDQLVQRDPSALRKKVALMVENNRILQDCLFPVLQQEESFSSQLEQMLDDFAAKMIDNKVSNAPLGLRVYQSLLSYTIFSDNTTAILKRLYDLWKPMILAAVIASLRRRSAMFGCIPSKKV